MVYLCGRDLSGTAVGARSAGRRRYSQWSGQTTVGSERPTGGNPAGGAVAPALPSQSYAPSPIREDFDGTELPMQFQWLRSPGRMNSSAFAPARVTCASTVEAIGASFGRRSLRGASSPCFSAGTVVEVEPRHFRTWRVSSATTTARSFTISTSRMTRASGSTFE